MLLCPALGCHGLYYHSHSGFQLYFLLFLSLSALHTKLFFILLCVYLVDITNKTLLFIELVLQCIIDDWSALRLQLIYFLFSVYFIIIFWARWTVYECV